MEISATDRSEDGTINNDMSLSHQCPDCCQKFDSQETMNLHSKLVHDQTGLSEVMAVHDQTGLSEVTAAHDQTVLSEVMAFHDQTGLSEVMAAHDQTGLSEVMSVHDQTGLSELMAVHDQTGLSELMAPVSPRGATAHEDKHMTSEGVEVQSPGSGTEEMECTICMEVISEETILPCQCKLHYCQFCWDKAL